MKRAVSLILSVMLMITIFTPGFAAANQDEELKETIVNVKKLLNIGEEYDKFEYNIQEYDGEKQYNFNWRDSEEKLGEIDVDVDSDGIINNYCSYEYNQGIQDLDQERITREEAKEIADKFIKRIVPNYAKRVAYIEGDCPESIYSTIYDIRYIRRENGINFPNDYISVYVNKDFGEIIRYFTNWNKKVIFDSPDNILSLDEAKDIYFNKLGLDLVYKYKWGKDNVTPYLVYSNIKPGVIDAKTGDIVNEHYRRYFDKQCEECEEDMAADSGNYQTILTEQEISAIENIGEMLSKEETEKIARDELNIGQDLKINQFRLYKDRLNREDFVWNISFINNDDEKNYNSVLVSLDARTGEIKSFYKSYSFEKDDKAKYNEQQSLKIAEDFIKKFQADKFDMIERLDIRKPVVYKGNNEIKLPLTQSFNFVRKVNRAYVIEDGFEITVNAVTGEVVDCEFKWYKGKFPSVDEIITRDEANDIIFEKAGMDLKYKYDYEKDIEVDEISTKKYINAKLIYTIGEYVPLNVDPKTGNILKWDGDIFIDNRIVQYTDIEGSIAEKEIKELAKYGISLPVKQFKPKDDITQREFLYLLVKAKYEYMDIPFSNDGSCDNKLYKYIIDRKIINEEEKAPNSLVRKEDALLLIIRALDYDDIASIQGIYTVPFKDADKISLEKLGHAAISYGLGIVKTEEGFLNPLDNIKKEEAALMLYKYLNLLNR